MRNKMTFKKRAGELKFEFLEGLPTNFPKAIVILVTSNFLDGEATLQIMEELGIADEGKSLEENDELRFQYGFVVNFESSMSETLKNPIKAIATAKALMAYATLLEKLKNHPMLKTTVRFI